MSKAAKVANKISPFRYPSKLHKRTETPPHLSNYRNYKTYLKREFTNTCVYCKKPDFLQDIASMQVEHYRPKDIFKDLICTYDNLYYSCAACNRFKGTYWSDVPSERILNPCENYMSQHLKFSGNSVSSKSNQGRFHVDRLRINNDHSVAHRTTLNAMLYSAVSTLANRPKRPDEHYLATEEAVINSILAITSISKAELLQLIK